MGASTERLALQVTSSADVSGLDRARAGVEGLRKTEEALGAQTQKLTTDAATMNRLLQEYGGDLQKAAQEAARLAQVQKEVTAAVAPTTRELQKETEALREQSTVLQRETTQSLTALERRMGSTSVAVVFGMESMVRGFAAGESGIRAALRSISVLAASTLGPGGIVIASLLAFGDAAVEQFTRAGRAAEQLRQKVDEEMKRLVNAQDWAGLQKQAQEVFAGTAANHFRDGIVGLNKELENLKVQLKSVEAVGPLTMSLGIGGGGGVDPAAQRIRQRMEAIEKEIKDRRTHLNEIMAEEVTLENVPSARGGIAPFTITESGRSALKQITLDMSVYEDELKNVLETAGKLRAVQIGMIGQDQLTPLQLLTAEEGRLKDALTATNLSYSERKRLVDELARVRSDEAEARKVINVDPKVVEKQSKEAMDVYRKSRQAGIDEDVAEEAKKREAAAKRIGAEMAGAAIAGINAHESLGKIASRMLLEPLEKELEGLAISETVKAGISAVSGNLVGAAGHLAQAGAALAGAAAIAQMGGFGTSGRGSGNGTGTFVPAGGGAGGETIVLNFAFQDTTGRTVNTVTQTIKRSEITKGGNLSIRLPG